MAHQLVDYGEEWQLKTAVNGATVTVGLYNEAEDLVADTDDVGDILTEPDQAGNYARQPSPVTVTEVGGVGVWGFDTDNQLTFEFQDVTTSQTVDSWFMTASFQAAGDAAATTHLIGTGALQQARDIGSIDTLNLNAGGAGFTLD